MGTTPSGDRDVPRIENQNFIWECGNGHTTQTPLPALITSIVEQETTVCICAVAGCDRVFEISDEFEQRVRQAVNPDE